MTDFTPVLAISRDAGGIGKETTEDRFKALHRWAVTAFDAVSQGVPLADEPDVKEVAGLGLYTRLAQVRDLIDVLADECEAYADAAGAGERRKVLRLEARK